MLLQYLDQLNQLNILLASESPRRKQLLLQLGLTNYVAAASGFEEDLDKTSFATPAEYCMETAAKKAEYVIATLGESSSEGGTDSLPDIVITCDSVVVASDGLVMEKAATRAEASAMLAKLSGGTSQVYSCMCVLVRRRQSGGGSSSPSSAGVVGGPALSFDGSLTREDNTGVSTIASVDVKVPTTGEVVQYDEIRHREKTTVFFGTIPPAEIEAYVAVEDAWRGKAGAYGIQDLAAAFVSRIDGDYYTVMGLPVYRLACFLRMAVESGILAQEK